MDHTKARQPGCRYHIQSLIPQLICFRYHLRKETNGWQLRLASLQNTLHYCWRMFVPQWLETPASTLLSSTLLVASHSSFPWQLMVFVFCFFLRFPNVSELLSDIIISKWFFAFLFSHRLFIHFFFVGSCMSLLGDFEYLCWFSFLFFLCVFLFCFVLYCSNMHFARSCYGPQSHFTYFIPTENPQMWTNRSKTTNITLTTLGI